MQRKTKALANNPDEKTCKGNDICIENYMAVEQLQSYTHEL